MIDIHPVHLSTLSKLYPRIGEKYSSLLYYYSKARFDSSEEPTFRDLCDRWTALLIAKVPQANSSLLQLRKLFFATHRSNDERREWKELFSSEHLKK
jgi:hypothetical protein